MEGCRHDGRIRHDRIGTLPATEPPITVEDSRRFWTAYTVSALGSGVGAGALPLVAIMMLGASDWQVSLLAALAGLAGVAVAVPLGPWIEFHRKRPVMIGAAFTPPFIVQRLLAGPTRYASLHPFPQAPG